MICGDIDRLIERLIAEERDRDSRERENAIESGRARDTLIVVEREIYSHRKRIKNTSELTSEAITQENRFQNKIQKRQVDPAAKDFSSVQSKQFFPQVFICKAKKNTSKLIISSPWKSGTGDLYNST